MATRKTQNAKPRAAATKAAQATDAPVTAQPVVADATVSVASAGESTQATGASQQPPAEATKAQEEAEAKAAQEAEAKTVQEAEAKAGKSKAGEIPALFVRTRRGIKSRRRSGYRFTREGHGIALDALNDEQVAALKADPGLEVEECTFPADEAEE